MKAAIAAGSFQPNQVITISLQNPTQPEAKRWQQDEISINGKMYDVISAQQANGKLTLKCICDEDENLLIATYKQAAEEGHKSSPQKSNVSLKNVFSPFVINNGVICFFRMEVSSAPQLLQYQTVGMEPLFEGVPTPPPRQV